jgi:hypothetical protein
MEQVEESELPFCSSCAQKNETNLLAKIPEMAFSVHSDRFFTESVSPQLLFFLMTTIFALNYQSLTWTCGVNP